MSKVESSTPDSLDDLLKKLLAAIPEVKAAAIVSAEGLPIASALPRDVDEIKIAAMTAALYSMAKRAITEMKKGDFDQLYIRGSDGYLLVLQAGPNAILMISADKDARLRLFFPGNSFPYIFTPPNPPDDPDGVVQEQVLKIDETRINCFCKHCGAPLDEGVSVCPNCKKVN